MKVIVHPGPAGSHPVLDVYELQPGQAAYAGPPDASIACGDVWLGSSYHSTFLVGQGGLLFTDYSVDSTCLPYRLRRYDLATGNTEILWNPQGTEFRSFALYPESGQVNYHLGIDYMKRLKYKIKIPYLRPHLVKERA